MSQNLLGVSGGGGGGSSRDFPKCKKKVGKEGVADLDSGTLLAVSGIPGDHPPFMETPGNSGTLVRSVFRSRIQTYASQDRSNGNYMV